MLCKDNEKYFSHFLIVIQKMFSSVFIVYKLFIFILLFLQSSVMSDIIKNSSVNESDINYTIDNTFHNDSYQNISTGNQDEYDFDFNKSSLSNTSFDVSTELESTISVTEDSENSLQSEANKELFLFLTPDEDICNCDLSVSVCDVNCCCDPDCSEEDVQVFSDCAHQVLTPDENYCYQKDIILRNNTVYKMVKDPNSPMFCIVHDNFKHQLRFKDMPVLKSHRDVITVLKYKYGNTYSWDPEFENVYDSREPRVGNPIYIDIRSKQKTTNGPWSLPSACLSDVCSCHEQVRYLTNFRSSCSHVVENVRLECERNEILSGDRFVNFCVSQLFSAASLTDLVVHTKAKFQSNSSGSGEYVHVSEDSDDFHSSLPNTICVKPNSGRRPRRTSNTCEGVVSGVHFTVEQDGGSGITGMSVDFQYTSIPLDRHPAVVAQSYSVNFVWTNRTEFNSKSGNPGYQVGLPVLAATNGSDLDSEEMYRVSYKDGLTVLSAEGGGLCSSRRQTVKFGKNLRSGCVLNYDSADCQSLRKKVSEVLLGPDSRRQIFVGIFGNANASNPRDWIEVFHHVVEEGPADDRDCSVSTELRIHVVFAAVGTFANPQYKIVGVRCLHSKPKPVDLAGGEVVLSTSVSFFDVTLPAAERYAKVPSIRANLPNDFFYPFMYGRASENGVNACLLFVLLLFLCLRYVGINPS